MSSLRWKKTIFGVAVLVNIAVLGMVAAAGQAPAPAQPMAEQVFKNIQVLKGIPADEFMDTMGMFASSLLYDCTGCHVQEILINRDAFATATPRIQRARQMVVMVNALNRMYFGGQPKVTCFTCHRASGFPEVIPDLGLQYGDGPPDNPNSMTVFPQREGPSADQIFRKYIDAVGGIGRVSKLTSYTATGTYIGFNTGGATVPIEICRQGAEPARLDRPRLRRRRRQGVRRQHRVGGGRLASDPADDVHGQQQREHAVRGALGVPGGDPESVQGLEGRDGDAGRRGRAAAAGVESGRAAREPLFQ